MITRGIPKRAMMDTLQESPATTSADKNEPANITPVDPIAAAVDEELARGLVSSSPMPSATDAGAIEAALSQAEQVPHIAALRSGYLNAGQTVQLGGFRIELSSNQSELTVSRGSSENALGAKTVAMDWVQATMYDSDGSKDSGLQIIIGRFRSGEDQAESTAQTAGEENSITPSPEGEAIISE